MWLSPIKWTIFYQPAAAMRLIRYLGKLELTLFIYCWLRLFVAENFQLSVIINYTGALKIILLFFGLK